MIASPHHLAKPKSTAISQRFATYLSNAHSLADTAALQSIIVIKTGVILWPSQ